jgi:hypothetical protein
MIMEKYFVSAVGPRIYATAWLEAPSLLAAKRLATKTFARRISGQDRMQVCKEDENGLRQVAIRFPDGEWIPVASR